MRVPVRGRRCSPGCSRSLLGLLKVGTADAVRAPAGDGRVRQRARDPDLPRPGAHIVRDGPVARLRCIVVAGLAHDLPDAAGDDRRAVAARRDRRARPRLPSLLRPRTSRPSRDMGDAARRPCPASGSRTCRSRSTRCGSSRPYSLTMAIVGLLESLLTATADRRHHRHPLRQGPRVPRPGHREHRHRLPRRHGRLRDDRPVDDQHAVRAAGAGSRRSSPGVFLLVLLVVLRRRRRRGSRWPRWSR